LGLLVIASCAGHDSDSSSQSTDKSPFNNTPDSPFQHHPDSTPAVSVPNPEIVINGDVFEVLVQREFVPNQLPNIVINDRTSSVRLVNTTLLSELFDHYLDKSVFLEIVFFDEIYIGTPSISVVGLFEVTAPNHYKISIALNGDGNPYPYSTNSYLEIEEIFATCTVVHEFVHARQEYQNAPSASTATNQEEEAEAVEKICTFKREIIFFRGGESRVLVVLSQPTYTGDLTLQNNPG